MDNIAKSSSSFSNGVISGIIATIWSVNTLTWQMVAPWLDETTLTEIQYTNEVKASSSFTNNPV